MNKPQLSIVLPVFNEDENVIPVLEKILQKVSLSSLEILVVYDFPEDTTIPAVQRFQRQNRQVILVENRIGRGVLNAIKTGFNTAKSDYVLVTMADGSDEPGDILPMLKLAHDGAHVVAGSRYMSGGKQIGGPRFKRTLSKIAGLSLYYSKALPIHDATSNFRLYSKYLLDLITIESSAGFELGLELTVKAQRKKLLIKEVPTTWRDRTSGESHFDLWRWLPHYLKWYFYALASKFQR
jgi:glycosyltransferase involved in cell wall biosynthesis